MGSVAPVAFAAILATRSIERPLGLSLDPGSADNANLSHQTGTMSAMGTVNGKDSLHPERFQIRLGGGGEPCLE